MIKRTEKSRFKHLKFFKRTFRIIESTGVYKASSLLKETNRMFFRSHRVFSFAGITVKEILAGSET